MFGPLRSANPLLPRRGGIGPSVGGGWVADKRVTLAELPGIVVVGTTPWLNPI